MLFWASGQNFRVLNNLDDEVWNISREFLVRQTSYSDIILQKYDEILNQQI